MTPPSSAPRTLGDVADCMAHAQVAHPGFRWVGTTTPLPNGRYTVDFTRATIYLARNLTAEEAFAAFIAGVTELDADAACRAQLAS